MTPSEDEEIDGWGISFTPGSLTVYDRALTDEQMKAVLERYTDCEIPSDGEWHTIEIGCRDGVVETVSIDGESVFSRGQGLE